MGYRTKPKAEIHGVRVSVIKKLIRRPFDTYQACEATGLEDPEVSIFLRKLEQDHILDYEGIDTSGFEQWSAGQQGERILSVKIASPKPVEEAIQALDLVMNKAFEIAEDTQAAHLPTEIWLFGSTLRGGDENGLVGDLDIAVVSEPRLSGDEQRILQDLEFPNESSLRAKYRSQYNVYSKLNSISRLVSATEIADAEGIDAQRQIVWRYDRNTGIESRSRRPIIGTSTTSPGYPSRRETDYESPPPLDIDRTLPQLRGMVSHIDEVLESARLARNIWFRGGSTQEVMRHVNCDETAASALLQWSQPSDLKSCYDEVAAIGDPVIEFVLPGGAIDIGLSERAEFPLVFVTDTVRMPCNHIAKSPEIDARHLAPLMRLAAALARDLPRRWGSSSGSRIAFRMEANAIPKDSRINLPLRDILSQIDSWLRKCLDDDQKTDPLYVEYRYSITDGRSTIQGTTDRGSSGFRDEWLQGPKTVFDKEFPIPSALAELPDGISCISIRQSADRISEEEED